jgi:hypothetical protein
MDEVPYTETLEAEEILEELESKSDEEMEELPKLYREKATDFSG